MTAVSGAEIAATSIVLKKLFQAEPVKNEPPLAPLDPEAGREMRHRQRHVPAADVLDEAADQDDGVADDREQDPGGGDAEARVPESARQLRRNAAVAFAADRHVRRTAQPALLQPEGDDREAEQHRGQHGGATRVVLRAGDREEDLGRQHLEIAGEHDRIAEVGETFDESQQERIGERRTQERPGHRAEHAAARCAQRLRGLFQRGAHRGERAVQDHEGDRRERQELRERHAGQPVDPARAGDAERGIEPARDEAGPSEQHDERQRDHERRRDDRQDRHHLEQARETLTAALHDQRQHQAEERGQHADDHGKHGGIDRDAAAHAAAQAVDRPDVGGQQPVGGERRARNGPSCPGPRKTATCRPDRR